MEIAFESKELRDLCESEAVARGTLDEGDAEMLMHRLADLSAASSISDLLAGNPRPVDGGRLIVIDLSSSRRLVFAPNHPRNPQRDDGATDWAKVNRVRIVRLEADNA